MTIRRLGIFTGLLLMACCPAWAADSSTACSLIFDNGLTSHTGGVDLTFERNAQLLNGSSTVLNFASVSDGGGRPTCDSTNCTAGGGVSETLDPGPFQSSGSSVNFTAPGDGSTLTLSRYKDVKVNSGATLDVTTTITEYFMDKITVESNATLRLRAGDYWIDTLEIKQNANLEVLGSGTARLFVNKLVVEKNARVNTPGSSGDPSKLFVYVYRDDVDLKQGSSFSGFLYAQSRIVAEKNVNFFGAMSAGDDVTLDQNTVVTYDGAAVGNTNFGCLCSCAPVVPVPVLEVWMDELNWLGVPGEVVDQIAGNNGRAAGGAVTQGTGPAVSGNPGTCRYGTFDGINDYVAFADAPHLDLTTGLTVAIWINAASLPAAGLKSIVSKDTNYEFHLDNTGRIYWWWQDAAGTTRSFSSSATVTTGTWHHVAVTYTSGRQVIYLDGVAVGTAAFTGNLATNNLELQVGQDQNFAGRFWNGRLDELRIYDQALSGAGVQAVMNQTHPCAAPPAVLGFVINHDGAGIHCTDEPFTVTAVAAGNIVVPAYAGEITLSTSTSRGSFSLLAGSGVLTDAVPDDGRATYLFNLADGGSATFALSYPEGPALVDVDAAQTDNTTIRDDDMEGLLTFAPSGFTFTGSVLPNPPPNPIADPVPPQTAGADFTVHLTAYGVTADDPMCGVIESYGGSRNLSFSMGYVDPGFGTRLATVNGIAVNGGAQPVTFNAGQAAVTVRYKDAGRIQLAARDAASFGHVVAGGSNAFVVRPAALVVSRVASGAGVPNPGAGSTTGPAFVPAGEAFHVDVEARDAQGDPTPNFGLETSAEGVAVFSAGLVLPAGGRNGSSGDVQNGGSFGPTATPGRFTNTTVAFDEVGVIVLQPRIADGDYMGTGPVPGTASGNVGRFFPNAFDVLTHSVTAACGAFTYMDQPALGLSYRLQALTSGGAVTQNYDAALMPGAVATVSHSAESADDGVDRGARLTAVGGAWVAGEMVVNRGDLVFARGGAPDGPFDPLQLALAVTDPLDGVALLGMNTNAATSGNCVAAGNCNSVALGAPTRVVYGRLAVLPSYGPENEALAVPLQAQIFQGGAFVPHEADDCSVYAGAAASLGSYSGNLQDGDTSITGPAAPAALLGGMADPANPLALAPPGIGNEGTVEVTLDVDAWLEFDWLGGGLVEPRAIMSFGRFRGHDRIIYWSERR